MNRYKVRAQTPTAVGFITQADHYQDYELTSPDPLEAFATRLATTESADPERRRWIMPGAIVWVEQK